MIARKPRKNLLPSFSGEDVPQAIDCRMVSARGQAREKIAFHDERYEVEAKLQSGGLNADTRIRHAARDA